MGEGLKLATSGSCFFREDGGEKGVTVLSTLFPSCPRESHPGSAVGGVPAVLPCGGVGLAGKRDQPGLGEAGRGQACSPGQGGLVGPPRESFRELRDKDLTLVTSVFN